MISNKVIQHVKNVFDSFKRLVGFSTTSIKVLLLIFLFVWIIIRNVYSVTQDFYPQSQTVKLNDTFTVDVMINNDTPIDIQALTFYAMFNTDLVLFDSRTYTLASELVPDRDSTFDVYDFVLTNEVTIDSITKMQTGSIIYSLTFMDKTGNFSFLTTPFRVVQLNLKAKKSGTFFINSNISSSGYYLNNDATYSKNLFSSSSVTQTQINVIPTASMVSLSSTKTTNKFKTEWQADTGATVSNYEVQYKDGQNGSWSSLWKEDVNSSLVDHSNTTSTSAYFVGETGHTYYFRVRALSSLGNEDFPANPDGETFTTVSTYGVMVLKNPANSKQITIILNSAEQQQTDPTLSVTQSGGPETTVVLNKTAATTYTGNYTLLDNYSGTATVNVNGSAADTFNVNLLSKEKINADFQNFSFTAKEILNNGFLVVLQNQKEKQYNNELIPITGEFNFIFSEDEIKYFEIITNLKDTKNKNLYIFNDSKNKWTVINNEQTENDFIKTTINKSGTYKVFADGVPPQIENCTLKNENGGENIYCAVNENGSGIDLSATKYKIQNQEYNVVLSDDEKSLKLNLPLQLQAGDLNFQLTACDVAKNCTNEYSQKFLITVQNINFVRLLPNPINKTNLSKAKLSFSLNQDADECIVEIYNNSGKKMSVGNCKFTMLKTKASAGINTLDAAEMSVLPNGVYFVVLKIIGNDGKTLSKTLKAVVLN